MKNTEITFVQTLTLLSLALACTFSTSQAAINNQQSAANQAGCYYFQPSHSRNSLYSNPLARYIYNESLPAHQPGHTLLPDFSHNFPLLRPGSGFIQGKSPAIKLIDANLILKSFASTHSLTSFIGNPTSYRLLGSVSHHQQIQHNPVPSIRLNLSTQSRPVISTTQYRF